MIGWASMHRFLAGDYDDYSVELRSKWSIETRPDGPTVSAPLEPTLASTNLIKIPHLASTRLQNGRDPCSGW